MDKENLTCCFTGYRPQKFPFRFKEGEKDYTEFENRLIEEIINLVNGGCTNFISGMAMGFDLVAADCVLTVREICSHTSVKLICAVPFIEQAESFPKFWKEKYEYVLGESDETILVSDNYYKSCYMKRNKFMVDNSDIVMTYFDGKSGGTKNTVDYAEKLGRKIINLYDR